jgi:hypothetical protein
MLRAAMSYRNDEEALRARVESLEDKLREREHEHFENQSLRQQVAELQSQLATTALPPEEPPAPLPLPADLAPARPRPPVLAGCLVLATVGALGLVYFVGMMFPLLVPEWAKVTAPFVCPSGYRTTHVTRVHTSNDDQTYLDCDGERVGDAMYYTSGLIFLAGGLAAVAVGAVASRRARAAKA